MTKKETIVSNKLCSVLEFILNNTRFSKSNGTDYSFDINKVAPMAKKAVQNYKKVMKLAVIFLFFAAQSFGQDVTVRLQADTNTRAVSVSLGGYFIRDIPVKQNDTIFCSKIIRCQTNNNSSLLMTKVKYLVKRYVNGELILTADDGKTYDVIKYYSTEYKNWISL